MGIAYQELVADMSHAFPASSRGDCGLMRPSAGGYGELSDAEPLGLQARFNFPKSRLRAWGEGIRTSRWRFCHLAEMSDEFAWKCVMLWILSPAAQRRSL